MATSQDPRTHITPDAFTVDSSLLGLALATPSQRLVAIGIDAMLAAIVSNAGIKLLVIVAAALLAWRLIGGPVERVFFNPRSRGRWVLRGATIVLAVIIASNLWKTASDKLKGVDFRKLDSEEAEQVDVGDDVMNAMKRAGLSGGETADLTTRLIAVQVSNDATASERARDMGEWIVRRTNEGEGREQLLDEVAKMLDPAPLAAFQLAVGRDTTPAKPARPANLDSALLRYADAHARNDSAQLGALRPLAIQAVASDTLRALEQQNVELQQEVKDLSGEVKEYKKKGGISRMLASVSDDLGLGFGWFALYFTAFTVIGRGQTPGKRLMRIKVIRLDLRPLGWWLAFERFGGYAASASTGLLGFAQILWDRNRQGLHDKATETVVIKLKDGQPIKIA